MPMIIIDDILVSEEVVSNNFACNLSACKGACCIEGDYGAPLDEDEILIIDRLLPDILPFLPEASQKVIKKNGFHTYNKEAKISETALMEDGACVFMGRNELGITFCGIEKAHRSDVIDFYKPVSCHLYPIRVNSNKESGFQALNYDQWDICSDACQRGDDEKIKIYQFVKDALIRKYGQDFYDQLDAAVSREEQK